MTSFAAFDLDPDFRPPSEPLTLAELRASAGPPFVVFEREIREALAAGQTTTDVAAAHGLTEALVLEIAATDGGAS